MSDYQATKCSKCSGRGSLGKGARLRNCDACRGTCYTPFTERQAIEHGMAMERALGTLKGCHGCSSPATIQSWHGGPPTKVYISCSDHGYCHLGPATCEDTLEEAVEAWNWRRGKMYDEETSQ